MKLPASNRQAVTILETARRILFAIRHRKMGSHLDSERYEEMVVKHLTALVDPYRDRIAELDEERREFSRRANEAYSGIVRMKAAIRDVLACDGKAPGVKTLETLKRLERTGFQHCRCKIVDEVVDETQEAEEDDDTE